MNQRKVLTLLLVIAGISGLLLAAFPLIQSMNPTAKAVHAATQNVSISDIKPGTYRQIQWQGRPVVIFRPSNESIRKLESLNKDVWGPDISEDSHNSLYVYVAVSTYLGCGLIDTANRRESEYWPAGWLDPCHVGLWDYSGRTFREHNATTGLKLDNLERVNFKFVKENVIQLYP